MEPVARCPELVVVPLEPAGANLEDEPAAGVVVLRARHVREQVRVPVRVAGDQRPKLYPLGYLGHGSEERLALEVLPVRVAVEREEVIPLKERVRPISSTLSHASRIRA
jgi:hypothetical protein